MRYGYTIFYVTDVEQTIEFYENAFGFNRKFITPEKDYGELLTGETTLAFASLELGQSNFNKGFTPIEPQEKPIGMEMAFVSDQIQQDFQKAIAAGAIVFEPIIEKPWGQQVGYLQDPNGILIEVCTPINS
ncbi:MAG: VOC family protein [Bacteroidota bacterium]